MTEPGSDLRLMAIADPEQVEQLARAEHERSRAEEARLSEAPPGEREPGEDYPDPDEAPPDAERHEEYDPLPPPEG